MGLDTAVPLASLGPIWIARQAWDLHLEVLEGQGSGHPNRIIGPRAWPKVCGMNIYFCS